MDTIVSREELEKMFGQTLQEVTRRVGGIHLRQKDSPPEGELYTVYVKFDRGVQEEVTYQDMEDFSKEYFNVVCGHIVAKLFETTKRAYRFSVPGFCSGRYQPKEHAEHFALSYAGDRDEGAQLIHLLPVETPGGDGPAYGSDRRSCA